MTRGNAPAFLLIAALWLSAVFSRAEGFGQLDETFTPAVDAVPGDLMGLAAAADGKFFVWGHFHRVGEVRRINLARLNADGTLDESFDAGLSALSAISKISVQDDDRVLAMGSLILADGTVLPELVRFMPDGSVDESFQMPENIGLISSFTLVPASQKILLNGLLLPTNNVATAVLLRLEPDGGVDASFNCAVKRGRFTQVQPLNEGKTLVEGSLSLSADSGPPPSPFLTVPGYFGENPYTIIFPILIVPPPPPYSFPRPRRNQLWRLNEDGSVDDTFSNTVIPEYSLIHGPNDVIYHGGTSTSLEGISTVHLQRFLPSGEKDTSFAPAFGDGTQFIAVLPLNTGKILVMAGRTNEANVAQTVIFHLANDGTVEDETISPFPLDRLYSIYHGTWLEQPADHSVLFFDPIQSFITLQSRLVKLGADGVLHENVGSPFLKFEATATLPQKDGKIYLQYVRTNSAGINSGGLMRLQKGGKKDGEFSLAITENDYVGSTVVLDDGDLIATVFNFDRNDGELVRLAPTGETVHKLVNHWVSPWNDTVAVFSDGGVAIARRNTIDSTGEEPYLRFFDSAFQPKLDLHDPPDGEYFPDVYLTVSRDGKLLVSSSIQISDGIHDYTDYYLQRLLPDGQPDPDFQSPTNPAPYFLPHITDGSGRLYVYRGRRGGNSRSAGGVPENDLPSAENKPPVQRFFPDGSLDTSFNLSLPFSSTVEAVWLQKDGRLLIGGIFYSADETKVSTLMRLMPDGSVDTSFIPPPGEVAPVSSIAVEADGNILVGGPFDRIGGQPHAGIARLKSVEQAQMKGVTVTSTGVSFQLDGNTGRTWWIQASDDLKLWETIHTITTGTETETVDLPAPGTGNKFYRAVLVP